MGSEVNNGPGLPRKKRGFNKKAYFISQRRAREPDDKEDNATAFAE